MTPTPNDMPKRRGSTTVAAPTKKKHPLTRAAAGAAVLAILAGWGYSGFAVIDTTETPTTAPTVAEAPVSDNTHPVDRVVDGDTVKVHMDGASVSLRLLGGDTPEVYGGTECFGPEASAEAKRMLTGTDVTVTYDPTQGRNIGDGRRVDAYGRDLVYLQMEDGTDFMEYMIRRGFATEYTYAGAYDRQDEYRAAEDEAQAAGRGLWASC